MYIPARPKKFPPGFQKRGRWAWWFLRNCTCLVTVWTLLLPGSRRKPQRFGDTEGEHWGCAPDSARPFARGQLFESTIWEGDDSSATMHLGASFDGAVTGFATLPEKDPAAVGPHTAMQLRGDGPGSPKKMFIPCQAMRYDMGVSEQIFSGHFDFVSVFLVRASDCRCARNWTSG